MTAHAADTASGACLPCRQQGHLQVARTNSLIRCRPSHAVQMLGKLLDEESSQARQLWGRHLHLDDLLVVEYRAVVHQAEGETGAANVVGAQRGLLHPAPVVPDPVLLATLLAPEQGLPVQAGLRTSALRACRLDWTSMGELACAVTRGASSQHSAACISPGGCAKAALKALIVGCLWQTRCNVPAKPKHCSTGRCAGST